VVTANNLSSLMIKCWCIHPDLIPWEKIIFMPEPVHVRGPPLFLDPAEIVYHSRPTLRYRILIDILEVEDWHYGLDSSSDDDHDDGGDGSFHRCFIRPWPKLVRFHQPEDAGGDGDGTVGGSVPPSSGCVLLIGVVEVPLPPGTDAGGAAATCSQGPAAAMCHIFPKVKGSLSPDEGAGFLDGRLPIDDPMLLEAAIALPQRHAKATLQCVAMAHSLSRIPRILCKIVWILVLAAATRQPSHPRRCQIAWAMRQVAPPCWWETSDRCSARHW
jgi:hypothetical protein